MPPPPIQPAQLPPPGSTPIYRIVHIDNLATIVARGQIHAPNHVPTDGLPWRGIHAKETQEDRGRKPVPCGPGGVINDYVGFYFGPRSVMLNRIRTGWNVEQIDQSEIIYLAVSAQAVTQAGLRVVFTDRHSLARVAAFYDTLARLADVDLATCNATIWKNTDQFPDRQEKKQAEFLVYRALPWTLVGKVGVANAAALARVNAILAGAVHRPAVSIESTWYY